MTPLLDRLSQPLLRDALGPSTDELLFIDQIYYAIMVDRDPKNTDLISVTKWTKVLNETRDDE